jgi:3-deoxy-manno-octulosonate cytidylyltransferase (CMP-KDO synthetase)
MGIYGFRLHFLRLYTTLEPSALERAEGLEQLRVLDAGYRVRVFMSPADTRGVDTPEDLDAVRRLFSAQG